jgi:hypothetical protein
VIFLFTGQQQLDAITSCKIHILDRLARFLQPRVAIDDNVSAFYRN